MIYFLKQVLVYILVQYDLCSVCDNLFRMLNTQHNNIKLKTNEANTFLLVITTGDRKFLMMQDFDFVQFLPKS